MYKKEHYEKMLEVRTQLTEATEEYELNEVRRANREYDEAKDAREFAITTAILCVFGAGFVMGGLFGKSALDLLGRIF